MGLLLPDYGPAISRSRPYLEFYLVQVKLHSTPWIVILPIVCNRLLNIGTKGDICGSKTVPRPREQYNPYSHRQHLSGSLYKQGRGMKSGLLCGLLSKILTWCTNKQAYSQSQTHSMPDECGSRQAIQTRTDSVNRMVPPSRGLPDNMQQVALALKKSFYCVNTSYPMDNC